jgi:Ca-activated chloride channel family protein
VIGFASSTNLLLLVVVAGMAVAVYRLLRWRWQARESFAGPQAASWPASPFALRLILVLIAAVLIVVAAARPQWGSRERIRETEGAELVIALDVSQSMQGTDIAPTRLKAAQDEINRLIASQRGNRVGLVFFAGTAAIRSPLTTDTLALNELIERAGREAALTRAGSNIGGALDLAELVLTAGDNAAGKAVLVVSDGEDHTGTYADKARALRDKGIAVFSAGVGTERGSQLFDVDFRGQPRAKLDSSGRPVVSRLDEAKLRAVADAGGGRYVYIDGTGSNLLSLRDDLSRLEQTTFGEQKHTLPIERYQAFVIAALLLLVESWALPARLLIPAQARLRRIRPHPGLAVALIALFVGACSSDSLRSQNGEANALFNRADYEAALQAYQSLLAQRPDVPALAYNAGNTLHRMGNYERAVAETQRALPPSEVELGARTYYALGNHHLALGNLQEAYEAYKNALLLNSRDEDAKYNLELTLRLFAPGQAPGQQPQPGAQPSQPGQPQEGQPAPGQEGPQGPGEPDQPGAGQQQGTPPGEPSTTPPPSDAPTPAQQRALQDALRGLDQELSFEEAIRLLDLLRDAQNNPRGGSSSPQGGPDY